MCRWICCCWRPSTYGLRLSELQANPDAYGFLTFVLFFRIVLVSAVVNLVYVVMRSRIARDSGVTIEETLVPAR